MHSLVYTDFDGSYTQSFQLIYITLQFKFKLYLCIGLLDYMS